MLLVDVWLEGGLFTLSIVTMEQMRLALQNLNKNRIISSTACRGISWNFNPPTASNFGGIWEREIRTIHKILYALYLEHGPRLSGELLRTFMCKVEFILNLGPLSPVCGESSELGVLSPSHLLVIKPVLTSECEGSFDSSDVYSLKRWKHMSNGLHRYFGSYLEKSI